MYVTLRIMFISPSRVPDILRLNMVHTLIMADNQKNKTRQYEKTTPLSNIGHVERLAVENGMNSMKSPFQNGLPERNNALGGQ